jgi:lipopolysaccharide export system permease protein
VAGLKKIDVFILRSFTGPFLITFFISTLFFLMQFLWKYIDELVGKGLEWFTITELLLYSVPNFIPLSLAMGVLLSCIMVFGNLGERYELVSIKASGVPLRRALYPVAAFVFLLSAGSFLFANNIIPAANLKFFSLFWDVKNKKPAFDIREGAFYNDIEGYSLKIGKKDKNGKDIYDIVIYDHTKENASATVVVAERGEMTRSDDKRFLYFTLINGRRYEEMRDNPDYYKTFMHNSMRFERQEIIFDLSQLDLSRTAEDLFKGNQQLQNIIELQHGIDSLQGRADTVLVEMKTFINANYHFNDTLKKQYVDSFYRYTADWKAKEDPNTNLVISQALNVARTTKGTLENNQKLYKDTLQKKARYDIEWHKKLTLPIACLVLFLIGAPLGAIVRKGGFGWPMVIAILLFLVFYILNIVGEKMSRELVVPAYFGMWLAIIVLTPLGLWLVSKASRDSSLFDPDVYIRAMRRIIRLGRKKKEETVK